MRDRYKKAYSPTTMMEIFAKSSERFLAINYFLKGSIIEIREGSKFTYSTRFTKFPVVLNQNMSAAILTILQQKGIEKSSI